MCMKQYATRIAFLIVEGINCMHQLIRKPYGSRGCMGWAVLLMLTILLSSLSTTPAYSQSDERCFAETGYCIGGRIREFWEQNGGVAVFGLPITPQQEEQIEGETLQVQWFERNRLELHPQQPPPFDVMLGRLGVDMLEQQGRDWWDFPRSEPQEGCRYFPETGHNVCGAVLTAWHANGLEFDGLPGKDENENLALFGLPLSDVITETLSDGNVYPVQWFERARFEFHPENDPPYHMLLGLMGSEMYGEGSAVPAAPAAAPAATAPFEPAACPFAVPPGMVIECGYLLVPQERSQADSRTIRLAVAVVRAPNPHPPDPALFYLSGGPGSAALDSTVLLARAWASFIGNRDFVVIDQRGTGYSEPALVCPESMQVDYDMLGRNITPDEQLQAELNAILACQERMQHQGVDFAAYHSAASAADLNDLRLTLGYQQVNLFGISYGTRLALTMMRDYPEAVRSAVLDSTYPLQVNLYSGMPEGIDRTLRMIFAACSAQPGCNAAYPDLEQTFVQLVERLEANPITIQVVDPRSGNLVPAVIDGGRFVHLLFRISYITDQVANVPVLISNTWHGNYLLLAELESLRLQRKWAGLSIGMYFAVQCREEVPFALLDEVAASTAPYPHLQPFFDISIEHTDHIYTMCAALAGTTPPDPLENEPVSSDIPTLVLAGEYDPVTPPAWGVRATETLTNSYYYEFPGTGHATITRGLCAYNIAAAFLNTPARAPDGSCVGGFGVPVFR